MAASDTIAQLNTALAGRYLLEKELGAGGMATVYLAHDLKHDRDAAIKVLRRWPAGRQLWKRYTTEDARSGRRQCLRVAHFVNSEMMQSLLNPHRNARQKNSAQASPRSPYLQSQHLAAPFRHEFKIIRLAHADHLQRRPRHACS